MTEFHKKFCAGGAHCKTCRDPIVGLTIRRKLVKKYQLPSEDFACDFGGDWNKPPPRNKLPCRRGVKRQSLDEPMPADGPGGSLHRILTGMGIKPKCGCGCVAFAMKMNRWGWTACLTWRVPQITSWLMSKAAEQKIEITAGKAGEFLLAAYQETLSRVRGKRKKQAKSV